MKSLQNKPVQRGRDPSSKHLTNADLCTSYVLQKIESGELKPGSRLGEPSLAKEIGTDRASVRTAFERLSATGILERRPRSGTYLKKMSLDDLRSANQVRCQLEVLGACLACKNATSQEIEQILTTAKLLDSLTETYAAGQLQMWSSIRSLEIEFHTMIARFSHNPYLLSMMNRDSFLQICFPFLIISTSLKRERIQSYLENSINNSDVARAIKKRNPDDVAKVMKQHVEDSLKLYQKVIEEQH